MGFIIKLVDAALFFYFLFMVVAAPIIDAQIVLPLHLFPDPLIDLKNWYIREYDDYLLSENPNFFVGIVWIELLYQWPLAVASLYGIAAGSSWLRTTSLIYGVSGLTCMVAILAELRWSHKASDKMLMMYYPLLGFSILAILRGFLPHSSRTNSSGKRSGVFRRKRA